MIGIWTWIESCSQKSQCSLCSHVLVRTWTLTHSVGIVHTKADGKQTWVGSALPWFILGPSSYPPFSNPNQNRPEHRTRTKAYRCSAMERRETLPTTCYHRNELQLSSEIFCPTIRSSHASYFFIWPNPSRQSVTIYRFRSLCFWPYRNDMGAKQRQTKVRKEKSSILHVCRQIMSISKSREVRKSASYTELWPLLDPFQEKSTGSSLICFLFLFLSPFSLRAGSRVIPLRYFLSSNLIRMFFFFFLLTLSLSSSLKPYP